MTREITADVKAARANETAARAAKRAKNEIEAAAVFVTVAKGGRAGAESFLNRAESLGHGEARFFGARGDDEIRSAVATEFGTGHAVGPGFGVQFAIRAKMGDGSQIVIPLDYDAAALVAASAFAHCADIDDMTLGGSADFRNEFKSLCADLAESYLDTSGIRERAHREERDRADLHIRALSNAAIERATEFAERKVYDAVRRLVTAAQLPAGIERTMLLEESQGMIKRAFGGDA